MAHDVMFKVPPRKLGKSDVIFVVKGDDGVLGTLKVSKGAVVWPRNASPRPNTDRSLSVEKIGCQRGSASGTPPAQVTTGDRPTWAANVSYIWIKETGPRPGPG
jgi:hypothetical protein